MKSSQLVEMIRKIVAEEVRKQLPHVVSEMYLKRLVSESTATVQRGGAVQSSVMRKYGLSEDMMEPVPEPVENSDEGIYADGSIGRKNESVRDVLLSPDNPYAKMYENVKPIDQRAAVSATTPIPVADGGDPKKYGEMFKRMVKIGSNHKPMQQTPEAIERDLKERRRRLDEQKV